VSFCKTYLAVTSVTITIRIAATGDRMWGAPKLLFCRYWSSFPDPQKAWKRETDSPPTLRTEFENTWSYTSTLLNDFMSWCLIKSLHYLFVG